ncbi:hypothetical protein BHE74_00029850 [Ensete ventricosum]|nr:hypothetical protein GW17_00031737 [Ensete ventricosum]RWW62993.1 hypothetical protein BHE74_00029850 [Ensete ventricosum]RZR86178.1 hypothetical protein BHM03_00013324 [Ensete ventricosum]
MEAPSGLGGAVPVPASQAAKKEWRAIPEHSFRSNGSEVRFNGLSEILEVQNSFEVQLKEHMNINADLKEQLHEREQSILELERKLEEKDRELRSMKIDTEAVCFASHLLCSF